MYRSLSIQNFRGFKEFKIDSLERVNLITGANDVGKTALLEALFLLLGETNVHLIPKISAFRGIDRMEGKIDAIADFLWTPLFHNMDTGLTIEIEGQEEDSAISRIRIRLVPRPVTAVPLTTQINEGILDTKGIFAEALQVEYSDSRGESRSAQMFFDQKGALQAEPPPARLSRQTFFLASRKGPFLEEDAKGLGALMVEKESYNLREALQIVEPRLVQLTTIPSPTGTIIYGDIGLDRLLPLAYLGEGVGRLASILLRITAARGGGVLIDEIENGLHYGVMERVWDVIAEAARRFDVQVFATTHSGECIQAAHECFTASGSYDFRLYRLDRVDSRVEAIAYKQETLTTATEMNMEVR